MLHRTLLLLLCLSIAVACDDGTGDSKTLDAAGSEDSLASDTPADTAGQDAGEQDVADNPDTTDATATQDTTVEDAAGQDTNTASDTTNQDTGPVINTAGCEAVFANICATIAACPINNPILAIAVQGCPVAVGGLGGQIQQLCQTYLTDGVAAGQPMAVYLNDATPTEIATCVNGQNCTEKFVQDIVDGLTGLGTSGDTAALEALLTPALAGCYTP